MPFYTTMSKKFSLSYSKMWIELFKTKTAQNHCYQGFSGRVFDFYLRPFIEVVIEVMLIYSLGSHSMFIIPLSLIKP